MSLSPENLYTVRLSCPAQVVDQVEAVFGDEVLSFSSFAPPLAERAEVEVLLDGKPAEVQLRDKLGALIHSLTVEPVGNLDWLKKVAQDYPPFQVGRWTIFGGAHRDKIIDFSLALQVDSSAAFGTGEHPTTKGCLETLDGLLVQAGDAATHWRMLDMGCGSGILSMAFAKATKTGQALGVDMERDSVLVARENAEINEVADRVRIEESLGYANPIVIDGGPYDLIMANIFADPLCAMAGDLAKNLKEGGHAILSGFFVPQAAQVAAAHTAHGLVIVKEKQIGEWSTLELSKPICAS